jgi:hypothetical protein
MRKGTLASVCAWRLRWALTGRKCVRAHLARPRHAPQEQTEARVPFLIAFLGHALRDASLEAVSWWSSQERGPRGNSPPEPSEAPPSIRRYC